MRPVLKIAVAESGPDPLQPRASVHTRISWKYGPAFLPGTNMPDYEEQMMLTGPKTLLSFSTLIWLALVPSAAMGGHSDAPPTCLDDHSQPTDFNNEIVLDWVTHTSNQFKSRGHISGAVIRNYGNQGPHIHISVQIGDQVTEVIEVIYNEAFGDVEDDVKVGDQVEACGDYITSNAPSGPYPASPDGAILHWVHMANSSGGHPHGYLRINGMLYGDEQPNDRGPHHGGGHGNNQGQNNGQGDHGQDQNQNNDHGNNKNQGQNQHQGKHYPKHQGKHRRHN